VQRRPPTAAAAAAATADAALTIPHSGRNEMRLNVGKLFSIYQPASGDNHCSRAIRTFTTKM